MANDDKQARLALSGYTGPNINDNWHAYLKDTVGWQQGESAHINDLEMRWLELRGAAGEALNDCWYDYLGGRGHLTDLKAAYWAEQVPLP